MPAYDPIKAFNIKAAKSGWACVCDSTLAFQRKELAAVAKLWHDKAGTRPIPARADLDARSLKPFLTNMTLLECVSDNRSNHHYRLRLHGTSLTRYAGDHTGHFVEEMIPPTMLESYTQVYDLVLRERRPLRVIWDYQVPVIAYLQGESFVAPLSAKDGTLNMLLSVTYTKAKDRVLAAAR